MNSAHIHAAFRGVPCGQCRKPIRLSEAFIKRQILSKRDVSILDPISELGSPVFAARCPACQAEAIYKLSQVVDFAEAVETRRSRRVRR